MTAHATIEERQRCLAAGMNDHISKPIDPANLVRDGGEILQTSGRRRRSQRKPDRCPAAAIRTRPSDRSKVLMRKDGLARVAGNRKLVFETAAAVRRAASRRGGANLRRSSRPATLPLAERTRAHAQRRRRKSRRQNRPVGGGGTGEDSSANSADADERRNPPARQLAAALDPLARRSAGRAGSASELPAAAAGCQRPPVDPAQLNASRRAQLSKLLSEFDARRGGIFEANQALFARFFRRRIVDAV